jgi:hypothetical protein
LLKPADLESRMPDFLTLGRRADIIRFDWQCPPSRRGPRKSDQGDNDTKWRKVRKIAVAENGQNRSRNDDRPKRQAKNASDRKRNQNGAQHLQSASQNIPPTRVTPTGEIALRPGHADRVEEARAKEGCDEQPY